jgi:hypothetical protein
MRVSGERLEKPALLLIDLYADFHGVDGVPASLQEAIANQQTPRKRTLKGDEQAT